MPVSLESCDGSSWAGIQLHYSLPRAEVLGARCGALVLVLVGVSSRARGACEGGGLVSYCPRHRPSEVEVAGS